MAFFGTPKTLKIAFFEVFNNALDKSDAGLLSTFITHAGGSIAGAGVTMGVVIDAPYSSPLLAAVTVATGLLMILEGINSKLGSYAERDTLRELIQSAVDA